MTPDSGDKIQPKVLAARSEPPDSVAAALALEELALLIHGDPCLTTEERYILEKTIGSLHSRQKRLP